MRYRIAVLLAAAASIVGSTSHGLAQARPTTGGPTFAGELMPDASIAPLRADFSFLYNSNVADSSQQFAAVRGLTPADEIYTPSLEVNLFRQIGRYSAFLGANASYQAYQHNSILNREYVDGIVGASAETSRCAITVGGSFIRRQTDLQDLTIETTQNVQQIAGPESDVICNRDGTLVPSLTVSESLSSNSNPLLYPSNYNSFSAHASMLYNRPLFAELSLIGQYSKTEFPNRAIVLDNSLHTDGFQVYAGGGQLERHFATNIDLSVAISETLLRSNFGVDQNFTGVTYDGTLTYQPMARLVAQLEGGREVFASLVQNTSYTIDQFYIGSVGYQLSERLLLKIGASNKHQDFVGSALVPGVNITRQSINSFFASAGFDISPRFSVILTVTHNDRSADPTSYDYRAQLVGLSLSRAF